MKYILLLYGSEAEWAKATKADQDRAMGEFAGVYADLKAKNQFLGGDPLLPTPTAKTVRVRDGKTLQTDGPFAETKDQLGGYFLIEAPNLDAAAAIAARLPSARVGCVEVRPVAPRHEPS
jgi:hypothetical protein